MLDAVSVRTYSAPKLRTDEILRYAGCAKASDDVISLVQSCLREAQPCLSYRVCFREFPIVQTNNMLDLSFLKTESVSLQRNLEGCHRVFLFAATLGLGLDRLIARYGKVSPAKALMLQAIGAERIESLCDSFQEDLRAMVARENLCLRPRFSPGYGDLALSAQQNVFRALDCSKHIGLSLNESLLMSPSKSVTAIIGIAKNDVPPPEVSCVACDQNSCPFRRKHP